LSGIKKLAGQTMWYGVSSIVVRSIGFLLAPLLTYSKHVSMEDYGKQSLLYATIPVLSVLFTYGFETAYFRFSSKEEHKSSIYSTAFLSILFSTIIFSLILWACRGTFAGLLGYSDVPIIAQFTILIIALDTLGKIPMVKLRQEDRPLKFAFVNIFSVAVMFALVWFFVKYCPAQIKKDPLSWVGTFYESNCLCNVCKRNTGVTHFIIIE
jgi:O-antigen/teichoic acid export membrane protein